MCNLLNDPQDDGERGTIEEDTVKEGNAEIKKFGYKRLARHYLENEARKHSKNPRLSAAAYHSDIHILVVGFNNGSFYLYEMPDVTLIHSLRYIIFL